MGTKDFYVYIPENIFLIRETNRLKGNGQKMIRRKWRVYPLRFWVVLLIKYELI